ncbi:MAG: OB-fold protein, partial [Flavitalea sp.]
MKKMIILSVLALIGFSILFMYREYTREVKSVTASDPDFKSNDKSLILEFTSNDSSAINKYSGKLLEISGTVFSSESENQPVIILGNDPQIKIRCVFDGLITLPENESIVIVRGYCTGFNKDELIGS